MRVSPGLQHRAGPERRSSQKRPQASDLRSGAAREIDGSASQSQHLVCEGTGEAVPRSAFPEHIPGVAGEKGERSEGLMPFKGTHPPGEVEALTLTTRFCPSWFLPSGPTGSRITQ